jgi:hypothetical protein
MRSGYTCQSPEVDGGVKDIPSESPGRHRPGPDHLMLHIHRISCLHLGLLSKPLQWPLSVLGRIHRALDVQCCCLSRMARRIADRYRRLVRFPRPDGCQRLCKPEQMGLVTFSKASFVSICTAVIRLLFAFCRYSSCDKFPCTSNAPIEKGLPKPL